MAETEIEKARGNPLTNDDTYVGTTTITFANGESEKDSSAITFSPTYKSAPTLVSLTVISVTETSAPARGPFSCEVKPGTSIATNGMTLTGYTTDPGGVGKSTAFTVQYVLRGPKT